MNSYTRKKTINGREYFYEMTPYWDREKKKIRYHSRYLGVQKEKGIEKARMHLPRNIFVYGPFIPVLRIIREMGIEKILDSMFGKEDRNTILVLAAARAIRSLPMDLVHTWYEGTYLAREYPCDPSSQRISRLLEDIGNSNIPDRFFSAFSSRMKAESSLLYDITTIASYSGNSMFEYGHAKDHGDLPQINLSLVMERRRSLPILFEIYPGSIVDVSTLRVTVERIRNLVTGVVIILDRGFFSLDNLKVLHEHEYIISATYSRKEVKHVFSAGMRRLDSADNTILYSGRPIFAMHVDFTIDGLGLEGYLYHDLDLEARERTNFHRHIREVMDTIEKTKPKEKKPAQIAQVRSMAGEYYRYIRTTVKDGKYHAQARNNAISQRENRMGRFMLVYRGKYGPIECLDLYRDKDRVEKAFEILKSDLDIFPLRERKPSTIRGLVFILFLSLIVRLSMRRMLGESGLNRKYSMDRVFLELEKLQMMEIDGKMIERERTRKQGEILEALQSVTCT
ncbi:Transposase [Thermoplasmatales archaeon]|nr:Transposase [Thermoplasmatales archaeon]QRF74969.1 Transposase [Thermoplasmatales archaeon]QRF75610.1 Transposase [Thermoplasmatales archaeon]